jgi:basic membrane protein A
MRRIRLLAFLFASLAALALPGCGGSQSGTDTTDGSKSYKVGLVFDIGGRGDKSFNDAAAAGLDRAQAELGVEAQSLETNDAPDRESQMRQLAANGYSLVFGVGFLF